MTDNKPEPPKPPTRKAAAEAKPPVDDSPKDISAAANEAGVGAPVKSTGATELPPERSVSTPTSPAKTPEKNIKVVAVSTCLAKELVSRTNEHGRTIKVASGRMRKIPAGTMASSPEKLAQTYGMDLRDVHQWMKQGHIQYAEFSNGIMRRRFLPPGGGLAPVDISNTRGGAEADAATLFNNNSPSKHGWHPDKLAKMTDDQLLALAAMANRGHEIPEGREALIQMLSEDYSKDFRA